MTAAWKTIRVFISSTFRDMHAERDYLVKVVFPALRERLEKYRIHFVDIDLRWGITEEEAQQDRVLDLCLEQIDDCRPFFVGILGERYGWVPKSFSDEAASKYGWVQHQTGKSVTELEIVYGVLRDPKMHARGMFFFRNPAFIDDVPEAKQADLRAEDDEARNKLAALKQAIRDTPLAFPPMENYACRYAGLRINWTLASRELASPADREELRRVAEDGLVDPDEYRQLSPKQRELVHRFGVVHLAGLEEFGRRVSEQLWQAIQAEHKLPDTPPMVSLAETDPLAEEAAYHEEFIESRLRVYVGREKLQKDLVEFAEGQATVPCLVTGPSGAGKSAAMARFVRSHTDSHPEALVIPHFVGASPRSTNLRQMLRRLCLELQQRFGPADEVPEDVNGLVSRFRSSLETVPSDARVVLVIDALNQLDKTDNAHSMYWLPWQIPPQVKMILSCIDDPPEGEEPSEPVLKSLAVRPCEAIRVEPLAASERFEIVSRVPSLSAKKLAPKQIQMLLSNPATENPLFLLVALEELRGFGLYEQVNARIATFPWPSGTGVSPVLEVGTGKMPVAPTDTITAIFDQVIGRLREEFDAEVVRKVLALLACSRSGMSQRELLEIIEGIGVEESTSDLHPVLRQLRPYLQHRGGLFDFFHRGLYKAVRDRYVPDEESAQSYHADLADYFHRKLNPPSRAPWSGQNVRSLAELPHHQTQGQLWRELRATLTALPFLEAKISAGLVFDLAGDFSAAIDKLPSNGPQRRYLRLIEKALRRDIYFIGRHSQDYPQGLLQCLWNSCWWYDCPQAAQHYVVKSSRRSHGDDRSSQFGVNVATPPSRLAAHFPSPDNDCLWAAPLHILLEHWRNQRTQVDLGFPWLRTVRPPPIHLGSAQLAILRGHEYGVWSVAISPVGDRIVSASVGQTARVWDVRRGQEVTVLRGHRGRIYGVCFSPDGTLAASACEDETVRIWSAQSGELLAVSRGHKGKVFSVCFSTDGATVLSAGEDQTVRVWNARNGVEIRVLRLPDAPKRRFTSLAFSPASGRIAGGCRDGTVRVWLVTTGTQLAIMRGHVWNPLCVALSSDGDRVVSGGSRDRTVRIWDSITGSSIAILRGHDGPVLSVAFSSSGDRIVSGSEDGTVRVWEAESGKELASLRGHESEVNCVAFSANGDRFVSGSMDRTVRVWDVADGTDPAALRGHKRRVMTAAFSADGTRLATGSADATVRVWDGENGEEVAVLRGHECEVTSVAFSPDGTRIVSSPYQSCRSRRARQQAAAGFDGASNAGDPSVRIWDAASGAEMAILRGHKCGAESVVFSPDGDRIASGSEDKTVRVWDAHTGTQLLVLRGHEHRVTSLTYSPDGAWIASGSEDKTVRVRDACSGTELAVLRGHEKSVKNVSYSPDGARIASGSEDKTVRVWDARTGVELAVLRGHEYTVYSTAFSPDGNRIASASWDHTVRVWDAHSGECLEVIQGSGDVRAIASGSQAFPLRAVARGLETVVERADNGKTLGWFPVALQHIVTHPSGRTWAGAVANHLYIITLEGDDTLRAPKA